MKKAGKKSKKGKKPEKVKAVKKAKVVIPDEPEVNFKGKQVYFFDEYHGFWRVGECYKETKKLAHIRVLSFLFKVEKKPAVIMLLENGKQVNPWTKSAGSPNSPK